MIENKEGKIAFSYNSDELFNDVSLISAYMAKNIVSDSGPTLDELAISDDDKDVFDVCVKQTLPNIYETLMKISHGIEDAFQYKNNAIIFNILDNNAYNGNVLTLVESTLFECLKYGVLTEFYSINTNAILLQLSQSKLASNLLLLNQRLFQLKKKSVSSLL
jgi:hypothetical protein